MPKEPKDEVKEDNDKEEEFQGDEDEFDADEPKPKAKLITPASLKRGGLPPGVELEPDDTPMSGKGVKELRDLIASGKEKGFLTYAEVNIHLPADITSGEQIDDVMIMFNEMDIKVVESDEEGKTLMAEKESDFPEEAEDADGEAEADTYSRSNDPVRLYLKKMGSVSLLTREGEVQIAKRIEDGENEILEVLLRSTIGMQEIFNIGDKLKKGTIREIGRAHV